jgi:ABC-type transporter Mla subunit MlaD
MANEFKIKNGLIVSGSADFEQDLRVRGTLTVDELHTSITTSSVIFESGSTAFGNSIDDTHTLTGSVNITGSITLNGQAIGTGKLDETTFNTYTSSYNVATSDFNGLTNSYNSFTTSYISTSSSFNTRIGSLESFSSSLDASFVNEAEFGAFSSSIKSFTSSINNYTTSLDSKLNTIDSTTGSLNTFTSSANGRLNSVESATASLYSFSSSVNNRLSTVETSTGSLNSFSSSTNTRLNAIETSTGSLNSYSSSNNTRLGIIETSTSSLNSFTSSINTTIKNKLNADGVISGSSQILNGSNVVSSSTQVTNYGFAITGSNLFKGTQTLSGSIIPAVDNAYDLGSPTYQWRDVYISSGSLYIDGTKVISSTAQELQITTDNGQSIKILESGTDSIILQTADGDIELKSNADGDILLDPTNGKIMLKGPVEILNGQKIQSSVGGTPVVFANDIVVSGSIDITGTIEGIDLTAFSSSINTRIGSLETSRGNLNTFTASAINRLTAIETSTSSLNTFTTSVNTKLGVIETTTASLNSYTSSTNTRLGVIEGTTGSLNTFTSSINTRVGNLETSSGSLNSFTSSTNSKLTSIESSTSSLNSFTNSINTTIKNRLNTEGVISGSVQINITDTTGYSTFSSSISSSVGALSSSVATTTNNLSTSVATTTLNQTNRLNSIEGKTGSYATTGSNIFIGNQTITGSLYISQDLIVGGSSSIQHISSSVVNIADNIITVNAQNPSIRFGGLAVIDSGSSPQVSGSMLFDSTNDQWIFVHQNQTTVTSSVLLMGPQTFNDLGNETFPTTNRILKSINAEHVGDSNITDTGTKVSINSNTEITGGLVVTGTVTGTNITTIQSSVNSLNSYTSSNTTNINAIQTATASLNSYTSSNNTRLGVIEGTTGSLNTFTSSASSKLSSLETASGSIRTDFNSYTSSNNGKVGAIETSTSSLNSFTGSINTTIKNRLNAEGVLSGSSQVSFGSVSGVPSGLVSGSSQVSYTGLSNVPSGIVSGSSQITYGGLSGTPSGIVSGSSQITYSGITGIPSGIVSGSGQIDLTTTANYSSGIKTRLNAENVLSSSAQVVSALPAGTVSGSSQVLNGTTIHSGSFFNGISVVSGSGQISFGGITGVPSGLVSGSSQVSFGSISGVPSGLVSGSSQITGIGNSQLTNSSFFVGTTSISLGRTSASQTLTGVSVDGSAGSAGAITASGGLTTQYGNGTVGYSYALTNPQTGLFAAIDNSNSILTVNRHPDNYYSQLGFSSNGNLYYRSFSAAAINTSQAWQTIWTSTSLTNNNQLSNGAGFLTGITSSNVTSALGFTPYNSTNPSGYITGINSTMVTNALGYTPYNATNPNGYITSSSNITGNAATATTATNAGNSTTVGGITPIQFFNNMGDSHSTRTSFDASTPSYNFGFRYVQGNTNGPATGGGSQFYSWYLGLGNDYPATGGGSYGMYVAVARGASTPYMSVRYNENNSLGSWIKIASGYADSAGTLSTNSTVSRDLYINGGASGSNGNKLVIGGTTAPYTMEDTNLRPVIYSTGQYPVITLNHTVTSNPSHGPTIQFTHNTVDRQWVIGSNGPGTQLDFGYSTNTNRNPHNGIDNLNGNTYLRISNNGNITTWANIIPATNGTLNLGSSGARWNTVFTSDLSLSNGIGDYTIVEGENDLFLYNNKQNKVYKFMLQEVNVNDATPKRPE